MALFTDSDAFAGTERHMLDLAHGLCQLEEVEVSIACPSCAPLAGRAQAAGTPVLPIEKRGLVDKAAINKLSRLLRSEELDIIHAHNGRTALSAALAVQMAGRGRFILTQHFLEPDHLSRKGPTALAYRIAHHWVNGHAAHFITVSEAARTSMEARRDAPIDRITVIPNGVPTPDCSALVPPDAIRAQLELEPGRPLIVCVARLEREKDITSLIAALPTVQAAHPEIACAIVGQGNQEAALRGQIRRLGLEGAVRLLGHRADPLSIVRAGDLFVLPSQVESFGLVLIEAMALGKPIVATKAGGPCEIVREGETGLLVPPANPPALAQAICKLLDAPQKARQMGARGRERFLHHYTCERMAEATLQVYQQAVAGPVGHTPHLSWHGN